VGVSLRKTLRLGPLHVNLSTSGVGLSAGVRGGWFGVDALGHPYVHAGRGGLYDRRRWPAATAEPPRLPPEGPPPVATHGRDRVGLDDHHRARADSEDRGIKDRRRRRLHEPRDRVFFCPVDTAGGMVLRFV
jgi:hypothetical protein